MLSPESDHETGSGSTTQAHRERVQEKLYAPEEHFQSICEVENGIEFLERRPDTQRQHQNITSMSVWEALVVSATYVKYKYTGGEANDPASYTA
ncbi:16786_t:CDS:2, partial [Racocetra fulgida]